MAKKVEKKESEQKDAVVVDVDTDVTSMTGVVVNDGDVSTTTTTTKKVPKRRVTKVSELAMDAELLSLREKVVKLTDDLSASVADNERLADELGVANAEVKSLRKELSKVRQDYKKCQGDNRANSALVETLNGEVTRNKARMDELKGTVSRLQDNLKKYANELSGKDVEISGLGFDLAMRDGVIANLEKRIACFVGMTLWQRIKYVFMGIAKRSVLFEIKGSVDKDKD